MAPDDIKGTDTVQDPATSRTVITDEDVVAKDDLTTATVGDAKVHEPPARSALPDSPVADVVGVGQGEHTPADPDLFDPSGRPRSVVEGDVDGVTADPSDGGDVDPSVTELVDGNSLEDLQQQASDRDLPTSGTKAEIAERIVEHDRTS